MRRVSERSQFGPCFGERGRLAERSSEGTIQCHICGGWYRHLGVHVAQRHEMTAQDYRAEFMLHKELGLVSELLHFKIASVVNRNLPNAQNRKPATTGRRETLCVVCRGPIQHRLTKHRRKPKTCSPSCGVLLTAQSNRRKPRRHRVIEKSCSVCGSIFESRPWARASTCSQGCRDRSRIAQGVLLTAKIRAAADRRRSDNAEAVRRTIAVLGRSSMQQIVDKSGLTIYQVRPSLARLKASGLIRRVGQGPGAYWESAQ